MEKFKTLKVSTFIAINIPDKVKKEFAGVQRYLDNESPGCLHLIPQDQLHITIAFLGKISRPAQENVASICQSITTGIKPFTVYPTQLGAFPRVNRPSVVWVGLGGESGKLTNLIQNTEKSLAGQRIYPIRGKGKISPHITIARVKRKKRTFRLAPLRELIQNTKLDLDDLIIPIEKLTLYSTSLSRSGPKYLPLASISLN